MTFYKKDDKLHEFIQPIFSFVEYFEWQACQFRHPIASKLHYFLFNNVHASKDFFDEDALIVVVVIQGKVELVALVALVF